MTQPDALKTDAPLTWSTGRGTDVWSMFRACIDGDLPGIRALLERDPALARCQHHYRKPLYFAVRENRIDVVTCLLERDPDPVGLAVHDSLLDIARDRGYGELLTLLQTRLAEIHGASPAGEPVAVAIRAHDLATVRTLLDAAPTLLRAGDARGNQPIHWAVMTRQLPVIEELLARGADTNARRMDGARPIQLANGDYHHRGWRDVPKDHPTTPRQVLDYLRGHGAVCDICTAAHIGDLARVRELLDTDPSLANRPSEYVTYYACSGTPLANAAAAGHREIVELLLARGADPNLPEEGIAPHGHALYAAVANRHPDVVRLLLAHGANPDAQIESSADALSRAIMNEDGPMIALLCSHGASRPMDLLAHYDDLRTAAAMLAANPDLADDPEALGSAASLDFVRLLLRYRPDLPKRVAMAKTPEITELLFAHGMNASQPDWLGITPLHQLARKGNIPLATIFLDHGADLHPRDEDLQSTPLAWAAKFGQTGMVEFLLERGAEPNRSDDPPWATPLAWATRRGHPAIADILRRHGAQ